MKGTVDSSMSLPRVRDRFWPELHFFYRPWPTNRSVIRT